MATKTRKSETKKSNKSETGGNGDTYQKFIDFLKSPMWSLPVMSFIEQRSIVFDKEQGDEKLYSQIYKEFRGMVDMLIECFCEDIGVKPEQVTAEVKKDDKNQRSQIEQGMLEPVLAAGDYDLFVHMMVRKNIELQLQALQMIEVMCGLIPAVLLPGGPEDVKQPPSGNDEDQERIILIQVMKQSKEEYDREQKQISDDMKKTAVESVAEKQRLEAAKKEAEQLVLKALALSIQDQPANKASLDKQQQNKTAEISGGGSQRVSSAKTRTATPSSIAAPATDSAESLTKSAPASGKTAAEIRSLMKVKNPEASNEEIKNRQEYLRKQRDKLLNMKREARMKAFSDVEADGKRHRPKTARAAKAALRGGRGGPESVPKISDDVLAARKALAQKLKQEVIGMP